MGYLRNVVLIAALAAAGCQLEAADLSTSSQRVAPTPAGSHLLADVSTVSLAASRGSSAPAAPAVARDEADVREITIPAGTTLSLQLGSTVSSRTNNVEDPVNATVRRPIVINGVTVVPAGSAVSGYVSQAQRSGRVKGRARIGVRFNALRVGDARYNMRTASINRVAPATKGEDATKIAIGAGSGAVIGAIADGKKGAAIGSAIGGAGGTGVVLATRGREVSLGRGAIVTTRLTEPLTVRLR